MWHISWPQLVRLQNGSFWLAVSQSESRLSGMKEEKPKYRPQMGGKLKGEMLRNYRR